MVIIKAFFFSIIICIGYNAFTQTITFQKVYGGPINMGSDWGRNVQQTIDGGYIVAGYSDSFSNGGNDFYLIKTDTNGDTLWTKIYGGINEDYCYSVQQTSDVGYILVGSSDNISTQSNVVLIKTYSNGNIQWYKTLIDTNYEYGYSVQQTVDGGYIICGSVYTVLSSDYNVYLIKTNSNGDTLWTKTYGGTGSDVGYSVQQTVDGGYIIGGYSYSNASGKDFYIIKTNSTGDTLWTKKFGGTKDDQGNAVKQTVDGGYIITGYTLSIDTTIQQVYLIKTDSNGDTLWTKTISNMNSAGAGGTSVQQTPDNGYAIAGYHAYSSQLADVYLVKTNSFGDTLWTKTYGGTENEWGFSIDLTTDGGYVIAGSTYNFGGNGGDLKVYLIKTDSIGNTSSPPNSIAEQSTIIEQDEINIFPNPFITQANIILPDKIDLLKNPELRVYDMYGNETVRAIITSHRAVIARDNLAAGMYFCNVSSNNTVVATGKFIVQ